MKNQKCILVITDGIGYNPNTEFNAFAAAKKPNYEKLFKEVPNTLLKTSGLSVGLPEGQMGNSEVGHMCIGSGRVIYQNLVKINRAIESGELAKNANLNALLKKCKRVHIIGLYSDGGVHSHKNHFNELIKIARKQNCEVFAHAISDGRDVPPNSGLNFIKELQSFCKEANAHFATLCGRFYAMDRDKRWERVKEYYELLNARKESCEDFVKYVENSYKNEIYDEFLKGVKSSEFQGIKPEDGLIFVNFRNDRMKQLINALNSREFEPFERDFVCENLLTMSVYDDKFNLPVIFEKEEINHTLAQVIAESGKTQLHTAETEKYAHVTFFFNGGKEEAQINEKRVLIPSPKVKTYDEKPQMSAFEVLEAVKDGIKDDIDFIVVNFANGDMVGHTGNYEAAIKAVEAVDTCLGELVAAARAKNYAFMIISDHGNCEAMRSKDGTLLTNHTTFDVFCFLEANNVSKLKENCGLSNVAASVLKIMNLEKPKEMNEAIF